MVVVLSNGLDTANNINERLAFLSHSQTAWTLSWLSWNLAALTIVYLFHCFAEVHGNFNQATKHILRFAVLIAAAGVPADLSAEVMQMTVIPDLASNILSHPGAQLDLFLTLNRISVMLTGYLANGLYTLAFALSIVSTQNEYSAPAKAAGLAGVAGGAALSGSCLVNSVKGMFWSNALFLPALLLWLLAVAMDANRRAKEHG
jgi:hypothetical protein